MLNDTHLLMDALLLLLAFPIGIAAVHGLIRWTERHDWMAAQREVHMLRSARQRPLAAARGCRGGVASVAEKQRCKRATPLVGTPRTIAEEGNSARPKPRVEEKVNQINPED